MNKCYAIPLVTKWKKFHRCSLVLSVKLGLTPRTFPKVSERTSIENVVKLGQSKLCQRFYIEFKSEWWLSLRVFSSHMAWRITNYGLHRNHWTSLTTNHLTFRKQTLLSRGERKTFEIRKKLVCIQCICFAALMEIQNITFVWFEQWLLLFVRVILAAWFKLFQVETIRAHSYKASDQYEIYILWQDYDRNIRKHLKSS